MDGISDEDVLIHARPLLEEFTCPVCFEFISNCASTTCGHSFCKSCLEECLNVKKTCPSCNTAVDPKSVLTNKHLDRISALLQSEKDKAGKEQFARLLNTGAAEKPINPAETANSSSIQTIFQKHLMKSLGVYEDFLKKLRTTAEFQAQELTTEHEKKIAQEKKNGAASSVITQMKKKHAAALSDIQEAFKVSEQKLIDAYDQFLKTNLVNPAFLPLQIMIVIESTGARYPFILEPTHTLSDIKKFLLTKPASPNSPEPIVRVSSKKNTFVIRAPFVQSSSEADSSNGKADDPKKSAKAKSEVKIDQKHAPLSQTYNLFPNSQIVMLGKPLIHAQTHECFKTTFSEADPQSHISDYYKCETCKMKWICKDCSNVCHEGHKLAVHILEHNSNWACCYCYKTGHCKLYQKK